MNIFNNLITQSLLLPLEENAPELHGSLTLFASSLRAMQVMNDVQEEEAEEEEQEYERRRRENKDYVVLERQPFSVWPVGPVESTVSADHLSLHFLDVGFKLDV